MNKKEFNRLMEQAKTHPTIKDAYLYIISMLLFEINQKMDKFVKFMEGFE